MTVARRCREEPAGQNSAYTPTPSEPCLASAWPREGCTRRTEILRRTLRTIGMLDAWGFFRPFFVDLLRRIASARALAANAWLVSLARDRCRLARPSSHIDVTSGCPQATERPMQRYRTAA